MGVFSTTIGEWHLVEVAQNPPADAQLRPPGVMDGSSSIRFTRKRAGISLCDRGRDVVSFPETPDTDPQWTRLVTAARAGVKTGLVVYLARLEQQNLLSIIGQFLGPVTKK